MSYNIAIDGPAGAGKSTVAKALSKKLNILYLDTGAMYRAVGLKAFRFNVDPKDKEAVECRFYGLGSDGTVSANKNSIKIISE